ncbi:hypothetical protein OGAPHI_005483 [Ogataea philodendri]|uniref:tRNA(Ile)-lysidine synthetase n=1 Tax=Ogataea philodendri TaxID=1378263 RepID=A0A9P8NYU3_9ASCO|nr:uncharacterized protein OGAPHI_005483 [Ogataea philodendri]KAH3662235.1 hypothetical protein OGAPHI_005483 [Ogataea philodendri]
MSLVSRFNSSVAGILPKRALVAVSGGVDSMVLLDLLKKTGIDVHAITIDHGLRDQSAHEAAQVHRIATDMGVEHHIVKIPTPDAPEKFEKWARDWRYSLISQTMDRLDIQSVLVAHHRDDQLETFLMRLAKNSTLFGLAGMHTRARFPIEHPLTTKQLIRPLLSFHKSELYQYAKEQNLVWFEDATNSQPVTLRNRIRKWLRDNKLDKQHVETLLHDVESAVEQVEAETSQLSQMASARFCDKTLRMTIRIPRKAFSQFSAMSIDRYLYDQLYQVSPASNYHHRYTTIDSKNATVFSSDFSLAETLQDKSCPEKFNMLKCLFRVVHTAQDTHLLVTRAAEKYKHVVRSRMEISNEWSDWQLFDNRLWIRARGQPGQYRLQVEPNGVPAVYEKSQFLCYPTIGGHFKLEFETRPKNHSSSLSLISSNL